ADRTHSHRDSGQPPRCRWGATDIRHGSPHRGGLLMLLINPPLRVYLCTMPVDRRKSFNKSAWPSCRTAGLLGRLVPRYSTWTPRQA
ncbi:MAG: hypothetical protein K6T86_15810, partial [Pirellulales bacterium]|nr:hypothetical protein [Pirellulales bacterium]